LPALLIISIFTESVYGAAMLSLPQNSQPKRKIYYNSPQSFIEAR